MKGVRDLQRPCECYGITQSVIRLDVFITNTVFCFMQKMRCIYIFLTLSQPWPKLTQQLETVYHVCMWTISLIIPVCMDKTSHYLTGITVLCEIGTGRALLPPINALEQFDCQVLREGGLCIVYS